MREAVIVEAVRTPIGRGKPVVGDLSGFHAVELLGLSLAEIMKRSGLEYSEVDYLAGGCVTQAGEQSSNITRNAWLNLLPGIGLTTPLEDDYGIVLVTDILKAASAIPPAHGFFWPGRDGLYVGYAWWPDSRSHQWFFGASPLIFANIVAKLDK